MTWNLLFPDIHAPLDSLQNEDENLSGNPVSGHRVVLGGLEVRRQVRCLLTGVREDRKNCGVDLLATDLFWTIFTVQEIDQTGSRSHLFPREVFTFLARGDFGRVPLVVILDVIHRGKGRVSENAYLATNARESDISELRDPVSADIEFFSRRSQGEFVNQQGRENTNFASVEDIHYFVNFLLTYRWLEVGNPGVGRSERFV